MSLAPVITVDGPSGVGKGTLCQYLASILDWHLLDSGALYRLLVMALLHRAIPLEDEERIANMVAELDVEFLADSHRVFLDGVDVSVEIRSEKCANIASRVAALQTVRIALLQRQRDFRRFPGLIADGRDMGTVVFPDAQVKLFITASSAERVRRRYKQLREKGLDANLKDLSKAINTRDNRDDRRTVAPLGPAPDAEVLDTTEMNIKEVCDWALRWVLNVSPCWSMD